MDGRDPKQFVDLDLAAVGSTDYGFLITLLKALCLDGNTDKPQVVSLLKEIDESSSEVLRDFKVVFETVREMAEEPREIFNLDPRSDIIWRTVGDLKMSKSELFGIF